MIEDIQKVICNLKKIIENPQIKIISFDIFDTLLVRPCIYPKDILYLLDFSVKNLTGDTFYDIRITAENSMVSHYTLDDIYKKIEDDYKKFRPYLTEIKNQELKLEEQLLQSRTLCHELYEYAIKKEKKVIAISDMYLNSIFLKSVLKKNGYSKISSVYVSNECKSKKTDGSLFKYVLQKENVRANEIFHIGDNFKSDYLQAKKAGLEAEYFPSNFDLFLEQNKIDIIEKKKFFDNKREFAFLRIVFGFALNSIYENENIPLKIDLASFSALFIFPIIQSLMFLLKSKKIQQEYDCIYFAARDGFLPLNAYRKIGDSQRGIYLFASRKAYKCLNYSNIYDYLLSDEYCKNKSLFDALTTIIPNSEILKKISLSDQEKATKTYNIHKIKQILSNIEPLISNYYEELRNAAREYYSSQFKKKRKIIVFDIGYNGSISRELKNAFPELQIDKIYIWETEKNKQYDNEHGTKTICLAKEPYNPYFSYVYEVFFSALEGSCLGFTFLNGLPTPIQENALINTRMKIDITTIQSKTLKLVEDFNLQFKNWLTAFNYYDVSSNAALARKFLMQKNIQYLFRNISFENKMDAHEKENTLDILLEANTRAAYLGDNQKIFFILKYAITSIKSHGLINTVQRGFKYIFSRIKK